jgi:hypothetical protein
MGNLVEYSGSCFFEFEKGIYFAGMDKRRPMITDNLDNAFPVGKNFKEGEEWKKSPNIGQIVMDYYQEGSYICCPDGTEKRLLEKILPCVHDTILGVSVSENNKKQLLQGKSIYLTGLKGKDNLTYNSYVKFDFENDKLKFSKFPYFAEDPQKIVGNFIGGVAISGKDRQELFGGNSIYVQGLFDRKTGTYYNSYVKIDFENMKLAFSKNNFVSTVKAETPKNSLPTYDDYKNRVPILQVAENLGGYKKHFKSSRLRPQITNGEEILLLTNSMPQLYRNQKNDNDKGTVIDFVKNRLDRFNVSGRSEAEKINQVLSGFLGVDYNFETQLGKISKTEEIKKFSLREFSQTKPTVFNLPYLTEARALSAETIEKFLPYITLVGSQKSNFKNIGFPYSLPSEPDKITGFELRNYGFKGFSAGGDKVNSVWLANLSVSKAITKDIYFAESAIDAMSFYDLNKSTKDFSRAMFVSTGGAITNQQIRGVINEFPQANIHTLFDNDRAGQLYNIQVAAVKAGINLSKVLTPDGVTFKANEREFTLKNENIDLKNFKKEAGLMGEQVRVHKPVGGKDFNEVLQKKNELNKIIKPRF